jgi:BASS family bile acid:Na+ symporter
VTEFIGSALALVLHRLHRDLLGAAELAIPSDTTPATYFAAIMLGVFGILVGYGFARSLKLHPRNADRRLGDRYPERTACCRHHRPDLPSDEQQSIMAVAALYSLFIVITSTLVTLIFRRANTAAEQKIPDSLL